jgi:hypothetical protein
MNLLSTAGMTYGQEVTFYISLSAILWVFVLEFRGRNSYKEGRM